MHQSIHPVPPRPNRLRSGRDVGRFLNVHLDDAHHPAEAREDQLRALALGLHRDRITDAAAVGESGDQDLLTFENHGQILDERRLPTEVLCRWRLALRDATSRSTTPRTGGRWAPPPPP